jgi:hypothetical protein
MDGGWARCVGGVFSPGALGAPEGAGRQGTTAPNRCPLRRRSLASGLRPTSRRPSTSDEEGIEGELMCNI